MSLRSLNDAMKTILVCPSCKGRLESPPEPTHIRCSGCLRCYPLIMGIPNFLADIAIDQSSEMRSRDASGASFQETPPNELVKTLARHHSIQMMRSLTEEFRSRFGAEDWIIDVGIGWGWHWIGSGEGPQIIGIDISLNNLLIAKRILGEDNDNVILLCADASRLPIRDNALSGLWSVQVFQHMPEQVFQSVKKELGRTLKTRFWIEIYNLNPARMLRLIYRVARKTMHLSGDWNGMQLYRIAPEDWAKRWGGFRTDSAMITTGYSELFFHPELRMRPTSYPVRLERLLGRLSGRLASLIARQGQVIISSKV